MCLGIHSLNAQPSLSSLNRTNTTCNSNLSMCTTHETPTITNFNSISRKHKQQLCLFFFFFFMASIPEFISALTELLFSMAYCHLTVLVLAGCLLLYLVYRRKAAIYLLDFTCYRPPNSHRLPMSMFAEHIVHDNFDPDAIAFQVKILERSGFSEETCIPPSLQELPIRKSFLFNKEEAETVMFSVVGGLLEKAKISPRDIDILITNSSMFSPTPSLSAMIINKFRMRSNTFSFNLSGMGCSAGIVSVSLANDLLRIHQNTLALIVSSEILNQNWYTGKDHSMLLTNCLFRMGAAAILLSSRQQDRRMAKYTLQHLVRTNKAQEDQSYDCIFQDLDMENKVGVSISKSIVNVAGEALKTNLASLGPLVLPLTEQLQYGSSLIWQKAVGRKRIYTPDFRRAFDHFCIHAGGKTVIVAIKKALKLREQDVEASKMTLHRFGNTSSSSIWYALSYLEIKGRMKKDDRIWQIAFGSGFKCNSAVWKCLHNVKPDMANAWSDTIHSYPVDIPDILKI
ncbi:probable 3-ketoacyl-CoA synthase 21 [Diospyros lotus]|uniref:probable 3-ketoacyl-CoA synthase 21 n=1 Tax=Diospyros lotus TaxID=55363 RepID=UPI00225A57A5|nr:probable 3-ketoacyl-CoA synthase 21 [Diospyros lotus]